MQLRWRFGLLLVVIGGLLTAGTLPANAASPNISHAYRASSAIASGNLVSFVPGHPKNVELANTSNGGRLVGVAVTSNDSLVAIGAGAGKIQVATSGTAVVLASTANGDINTGDQVAVSPFSGLSMKAGPSARVIGVAQSALHRDSTDTQTREVTDTAGQRRKVTFGSVRVLISVGVSAAADAKSGSQNLNALQRFVRSFTGRTVSTLRIIISLVIALVSLAALVTLVYGSIYGSIIAVGRNPLARYMIYRTLVSVMIMALLVGFVAAITIFFLLR